MALPTLIKTWLFSENNTISVGGRFDGYGELTPLGALIVNSVVKLATLTGQ